MSHKGGNTAGLLAGARGGDPGCFNSLIEHCTNRFVELAEREIRDFRSVRRFHTGDDFVSELVVRMLEKLKPQTLPESSVEWYSLAATVLRHLLIDEHRAINGQHGLRRKNETWSRDADVQLHPAIAGAKAPLGSTPDAGVDMAELHEQLALLPSEIGEVMRHRVYNGLKGPQLSVMLNLSEDQVQRRLRMAQELIGRYRRTGKPVNKPL